MKIATPTCPMWITSRGLMIRAYMLSPPIEVTGRIGGEKETRNVTEIEVLGGNNQAVVLVSKEQRKYFQTEHIAEVRGTTSHIDALRQIGYTIVEPAQS